MCHASRVKLAIRLLPLALVVSACGSGGGPPSAAPPRAEAASALAGSPPALAALHRQSARLLPGGAQAFQARLAALRGHPVVVNKWASWCGPCRSEFPFLQRLSVELGRRVAFLGVDADDSDADAAGFLRRYPVSYPSYSDPDQRVAKLLDATFAFPTTVFYDAAGKLTYVHQGAYASEAKLRADILRYGRQ